VTLFVLLLANYASAWPHLAASLAPLNTSYTSYTLDSPFQANLTALHAELGSHHHAAVLIICRASDRLADHWTAAIEGSRDRRMPVFFVFDGLYGNQVDGLWPVGGAPTTYAVTLNSSAVEQNGFRGVSLVSAKGVALGWDKALFFGARLAPRFSLLLLLECDVLVPSLHALHALAALGEPRRREGDDGGAGGPDLLIRSEWRNDNVAGFGNGNWRSIHLEFGPPFYYSMAAAVGVRPARVMGFLCGSRFDAPVLSPPRGPHGPPGVARAVG
jgi:hypothetical protein